MVPSRSQECIAATTEYQPMVTKSMLAEGAREIMRSHSRRIAWIRSNSAGDCGPAALAAVARYYGLHVTPTRIREIAGTDLQGTSLSSLCGAARDLGFDCSYGRVKEDQLTYLPLPAICHIISYSSGHFVVIDKIDKKWVHYVDPNDGQHRTSITAFREMWTEYALLLTPSPRLSPNRRSPSSLWVLITTTLRRPATLGAAAFLAILITSCGLLAAWCFKEVIDRISANSGLRGIFAVLAGYGLIAFGRVGASFAREVVLSSSGRVFEIDMGVSFMERIITMPLAYFASRGPGDILSRTFDISSIRASINEGILSLCLDITIMMVVAIGLTWYNKVLAAITLVLLPVAIFVTGAMLRSLIRTQAEYRESFMRLAEMIIGCVDNIGLIKLFTAEPPTLARIRSLYKDTQDHLHRSSMQTSSLRLVLGFASQSVSVCTLAAGAVLIDRNAVTLGQLLFFYSLFGIYLGAAERIAPSLSNLQEALVGIERVNEATHGTPEHGHTRDTKQIPEGVRPSGPLTIDFDNVWFSYRPGEFVFRGITMHIPAGRCVALVGETGAGKSTMAALMTRLYSPQQGRILIDDVNIASCETAYLRGVIATVSQDTRLLPGTIRENLLLANPDASHDKLKDACRAACIHDFIMSLPNQYEYRVGTHGCALSGGQRQRLALARALIRNASLLILDEASSNLDTLTEEKVLASIFELCPLMTVLMITHRLRSARRADLICVLKNGVVQESGTHASLLRAEGTYATMWRIQTSERECDVACN